MPALLPLFLRMISLPSKKERLVHKHLFLFKKKEETWGDAGFWIWNWPQMYSCLASIVTYIYFIGIDIEYLTQYPSIAVNIYISLFPRSYIFVLVLIIFSLYALEPSSVEKVKLELRPGLPICSERAWKSCHAVSACYGLGATRMRTIGESVLCVCLVPLWQIHNTHSTHTYTVYNCVHGGWFTVIHTQIHLTHLNIKFGQI